jgi:hypothetical protein
MLTWPDIELFHQRSQRNQHLPGSGIGGRNLLDRSLFRFVGAYGIRPLSPEVDHGFYWLKTASVKTMGCSLLSARNIVFIARFLFLDRLP